MDKVIVVKQSDVNVFFYLCQVSMELTVRTTLMTVQVISVQMEERVWMESIPTTVSALQSGLVRKCVNVCMNACQLNIEHSYIQCLFAVSQCYKSMPGFPFSI